MLHGQYQFLMKHFNYSNILTIDDLYEIADEHSLNIFSLYRHIVKLIKNNIIEKVIIKNNHNNATMVYSKTLDTEFAFIQKRKRNTNPPTLSQNEMDILLNNI